MKKLFLVLLPLIPATCLSQLITKTEEFWPEVNAYYKFNDKFRLFATASGTKQQTSYSEGAIGVFLDYFTYPFINFLRPHHNEGLPKKYLWLRVGYQYSRSPPEAENPFHENTFVTEANGRFDLGWDVLMTVRNRFDWRFKSDGFFVRYRPKIYIEKDFHTEYLFFTPYLFGEYFGNFGNSSINKFRTQLGVEIKVSRTIGYETYWNHQFANSPDVSKVDAYGMSLKLYFARKTKNNKQ